nr:MAG: DNA pilot protein [Microvirus sp.]
MIDPVTGSVIFSSILGGLGTAGQMSAQDAANKKNEQLTRESWSREDNAVQRRAEDMKRAGINPLLAAGSAATSSGAIQQQPTLKNNAGIEVIEALRGLVSAENTRAQTDLIKAQQSGTMANTKYTDTQTRGLEQEIEYRKETNPSSIEQLKAVTSSAKSRASVDALMRIYENTIMNEGAVREIQQADGSYRLEKVDPKTNYQNNREREAQIQEYRKLAERYSDDKVQQDLIATALAIKNSGMQNEILAQLKETQPGLAQGISNWLEVIGKAIKVVR